MWRIALLAAALVLASCDAATIPERTTFYDFSLTDPPLVFHWPAGSSIRIHVASTHPARGAALSDAARHAAAAWNDVALFGEYELSLTNDVEDADVVLRWTDEPTPVETPDPIRCSSIGGRAVTTFCPDVAGERLLVFPLREAPAAGRTRFVITISANVIDQDELRRLVTHEVGHSLGLWNHPSPTAFPQSVMLSSPSTDVPTAIDRATVQVLYHTPPDVSL